MGESRKILMKAPNVEKREAFQIEERKAKLDAKRQEQVALAQIGGTGATLGRIARMLSDALEAEFGRRSPAEAPSKNDIRRARDLAATWAQIHGEMRATVQALSDDDVRARLAQLSSVAGESGHVVGSTLPAQLVPTNPTTPKPDVYEPTTHTSGDSGVHALTAHVAAPSADPLFPLALAHADAPVLSTNFSDSRISNPHQPTSNAKPLMDFDDPE